MNESTTILLISKNSSVIAASRKALAKENNLKLLEKKPTSENLFALLSKIEPDVVLLDFEFQDNPAELLQKIASQSLQSTVVVILPESELAHSDQVALSGAAHVVPFPYQSDQLVSTIKEISQTRKSVQTKHVEISEPEAKHQAQNIYTIFSPKGGVGTTTIAVNLAISLHRQLKKDTLLIDGKNLFGHVPLYCNIRTGNSITDLIAHAGMLDERLIKQVAEQHTSGIHVLPGPNSITETEGIKPGNLYKVLLSLQQTFPIIIIDGGNYLNENIVTYMDASDKILLVLNADLASIRDARQFLDIAASLTYPKEKTQLILNLTGRKADVRIEEIEKILKTEFIGKIPADETLALSSLNEGVPIILKKPRHPISKAFDDIANVLIKG